MMCGCGIREMGLSPGFWLRAWVLVALGHQELHGYELMSKLYEVLPGLIIPGPSGMGRGYQILRMMEIEGLVWSKWDTEEAGPAKRVYTLTPEGKFAREKVINSIKDMKVCLGKFLNYAQGVENKVE